MEHPIDTSTEETPHVPTLSDEERFIQFMSEQASSSLSDGVTGEGAESTPEKNPYVELLEKRQKTIEYLVDYYGGQLFQYQQWGGTITQMLDLCPAIKRVLDDGPEAIIAWLEPYKVDEIVDLIDTKDTDTDDENVQKNAEEEKARQEELAKKTQAEQKKGEVKKLEAKKPEVKKAEAKNTKRQESVSSAPLMKKEKSEPKKVSDLEKAKSKPAKKQKLDEYKKDESPEPFRSEKKPVLIKKEVETKTKAEVPQSEKEKEIPAEKSTTEIGKANREVKVEEKLPEIQAETPLLHSTVRFEQEGETLVIEREKPSEFLPDAPIVLEAVEPPKLARALEISSEKSFAPQELMESWQTLAESEKSFESLVVQMVHELMQTPIETEKVVPPIEFNIESLEEDASPELVALYTAVVSVRKTIDRLYRAKTQEECRECIDQIIIELAVILRSLGYDNPEKIIRDFIYTQPTDSLRGLMYQLEQALREKIYSETQRKSAAKQAPAHHHERLGKISAFIMQLLVPQERQLTQ